VKRCYKCQESKEDNSFLWQKGSFGNICFECRKKRRKEWEEKNKERIKKQKVEYRKQMSTKIKETYLKNREHKLKLMLEYGKKNRDKIRVRRRVYEKSKRKLNIAFRIQKNTQRRLLLALRGKVKNSSTLHLLGCSIEALKQWLSYQFALGMTWDNYGEWHIDHVRPCASFDLTDPEQQKQCFHWTNLQPLWAEDNLRKNSYFAGVKYGIGKTSFS
jgi:hypothetical protein